MKLIVGLGNPGKRYEATAHNIGFDAVDELARRWQLVWREHAASKALLAEGIVAGQPALLAKPQTFMNLSGETVAQLSRNRPLGDDDLLVVLDEVELEIGRLRFRPAGSAGGHNGLKSVVERLGTQAFSRLRIGVLSQGEMAEALRTPRRNLADYVLRKLPPLEREQLAEMAAVAAEASEVWCREGVRQAAEKFNGRKRFTT